MTHAVLAFENVSVSFAGRNKSTVQALDNVSIGLRKGEILGIVGESGSGKTTLAKVGVGLVQATAGKIFLDEQVLSFAGAAGKRHRRRLQYVLQDSLGSLDPRQRVLAQVAEPLIIHNIGAPRERSDMARALLARMGIGAHLIGRYPRTLSGGQRQRVALARALILEPEILICDESVSALDVSVQAQILNLLMELQREHGLSILFISHDLAVVHHVSDRVAVMRHGKIVEFGPTELVYGAPQHQYTRQLIAASPSLTISPSHTAPAMEHVQ